MTATHDSSIKLENAQTKEGSIRILLLSVSTSRELLGSELEGYQKDIDREVM